MIELREPMPGHMIVVEREQLDSLTQWEWKLVAVLPETVVTNLDATQSARWNDAKGRSECADPIYGPGHRYLLVKSENETIRDQLKEIDKRRESEQIARDCAEKASKTASDLEGRVKKLTAELQASDTRFDDAINGRNELRERCRRMETDVAKLRTAIGDIEFKRIVGGEVAK